MSGTVRWVIVAVVALLVVGLLIWAGGAAHHRGDEVDQSMAMAAAHV